MLETIFTAVYFGLISAWIVYRLGKLALKKYPQLICFFTRKHKVGHFYLYFDVHLVAHKSSICERCNKWFADEQLQPVAKEQTAHGGIRYTYMAKASDVAPFPEHGYVPVQPAYKNFTPLELRQAYNRCITEEKYETAAEIFNVARERGIKLLG